VRERLPSVGVRTSETTTERKFSRFRPHAPEGSGAYTEIPAEGLCLSTFALLSEPGRPGSVVMGRLDPSAPWARIGALDRARAEQHQNGWMLPSSHLLHYEPPIEAARRILREQLDLTETVPFSDPTIFSDAYERPNGPPNARHWDLGFLYRGPWPAGQPLRARAWKELAFIDVERTPRIAIARSHADVLDAVGLRAADR
jgi:ADP-ribose pyrophosphatase YjhB (NUDIX family)